MRILDRFLNQLPTVTIREGHRLKVYLTADLALPAYRRTSEVSDEKTMLVLVLIATLAVSAPSRAQMVVFDPVNFISALERLAQLVQQDAQMVQTYQQIRAQYDDWVWMARRLSGSSLSQYRASATSWRSLSAGDMYHTLDGWISAVNTARMPWTATTARPRRCSRTVPEPGACPPMRGTGRKTRFGQVELLDARRRGARDHRPDPLTGRRHTPSHPRVGD